MAGKSVAVMDVRSSEIAIFVGEMGVNRTFVFKASKTEPYGGYQDGEFFNMDEFSDAVSRALTAVEQICGKKIKVLYIGVPGEFMQVIPKEQVLSFPKRIKIGAKEVGLLHNSGAEKLEGYKLIRSTSMIYTTSDNRRVANPIGMYSTGLSGILSYFYCTDYFIDAMKQTFKDQKISLFYLPTDLFQNTLLNRILPQPIKFKCDLIGFSAFTHPAPEFFVTCIFLWRLEDRKVLSAQRDPMGFGLFTNHIA